MQRIIGRQTENAISDSNPAKLPGNTTLAEQVKAIFFLCLANWYWFVISVGICFGYAVFYLKKTVPIYERSTSILIKSEDKTSDNAALVDLGLVTINTNLTNELMSLKTSTVASEIVRRLNLDVEYRKKGTFHDNVIYGAELPVRVAFQSLDDNENASFKLWIDDDKIKMTDFVRNGMTYPGDWTTEINDTIQTPVGKLVVTPTQSYSQGLDYELEVVRSNIHAVAGAVQGKINPYVRGGNSSIIDITYRDVSPSRAEDILNTLVSVYNENWVKERNQKTVNTNEFIKERLAYIEEELGEVEQSISDWKSSHLILDVDATGGMAQSRAMAAEDQSQELSNQMYMTKYVRSYLTDSKYANQLLPANAGLTNPSILGQISEYNSLLLQRNNHLANSSLQNPLVRDMDEQLSALRASILQSIDHEINMLQNRQNQVRSQYNQAIGKVAATPQQSKQLLSVERQQKVKEQLYLFLLQRREENELSQAFAAYNSQLIEPPHGSGAPIEPKHGQAYALAIIIGLAFPAAFIALTEILNTKVRGKKDVEDMTVPYVGEIPQAGKKKRLQLTKTKAGEIPKILVEAKNRNIINEAFRVLRTNLNFMLGHNGEHPVIMFTSLNPGSGKTFLSANLSTAFSLHGKKVLAIDMDMRKGSLSEYVDKPEDGVSNYLSGQKSDWHDLVTKIGNVDFLPVGALPPNPAELLLGEKFEKLINEAKKEYDYIFIDCPPVEVVADAAIINRYVDLTIFVIRVNHLERMYLSEIENWYREGKYNNMAILLNGTDAAGKYGYHRHGYGYGYGYGYEYGYGYGNGNN